MTRWQSGDNRTSGNAKLFFENEYDGFPSHLNRRVSQKSLGLLFHWSPSIPLRFVNIDPYRSHSGECSEFGQ